MVMILMRGSFSFVLTCGAAPEQYDVYADGRIVAYVRLRGSKLRAHLYRQDLGPEVPRYDRVDWENPFYVRVFPAGENWLCFDSDEIRDVYLAGIVDELTQRLAMR